LDRYFRNAEVVTMRSGWNDRDAIFIGFKAGDNKANHSNLDLGTFVLDALGCRWAVDLGADNYNLPAYFGNKRWTYYRMRAEGHNVLIVNPGTEPDQDPTAAARITHVQSRPDSAFALADLTPAIARHARKFERGIALVGRKQVLVQDEVRANQPVQAWWFMHTPAQIEVGGDGASAVLSQSGKTMTARILAPPGAKFEVMDARPLTTSPNPDGQNQNQGIRKLAVHLENVTDLRLAVLLTPTTVGDSPKVKPFVEW
jgi:hypothetical protein